MNQEKILSNIINLEFYEKYKNINNNIYEIEARGIRDIDNIYFKAKDIFSIFSINGNILNNDNYHENIDYVLLNSNFSKKIFLTSKGLNKFIILNNFNIDIKKTFVKWLNIIINKSLDNGYVYCVTSKICNGIKIGYWNGTLCNLRKRYITSYGNDIDIFYVYTLSSRSLEKKCHIHFKKYNITNEIFEKEHHEEYKQFLIDNKIDFEIINENILPNVEDEKREENDEVFTCNKCNKIFDYKSNYLRHVNRKFSCIKEDDSLQCEYCSKEFTTKGNLSRHIKGYCLAKKNQEIIKNLINENEKFKNIYKILKK